MRKAVLFLSAAAVALAPSALPAQYAQRTIDPRYAAQAQREYPQVIQEFGGADTGPRADYVRSVGRRVAAQSGIANPAASYHFTILNSAVENAFSVPGGYVYITRQLMSLMDDEAELAFALGHEVGHIAANHAQQREAVEERLEWSALPAILFGSIIGGNLGNTIAVRSLLSAKLQTLSFSREQEYEADTLGLKYMVQAGYDPEGAPAMLDAISRRTALEARVQGRTNRQIPEWALTHPLSQNRMQRALSEARASGRLNHGITNRQQFLSELEGIYVDDDPAQGVIDGRTFTHPDLRIQFTVPVGYLMQNGTDAVSISGSAGEAEFSGGRYQGTLDSYIAAVIRQLTDSRSAASIPRPRRTVINGMPAEITTVSAQSSDGPVDVSIVAYQWAPGTVYHFLMLTSAGSGIGPFAPMVSSIRKITPAEAAQIRPRIIHVHTVKEADTIRSLASRMAYGKFRLERFLSLNDLDRNARLRPGQKVKLIVYGERRS